MKRKVIPHGPSTLTVSLPFRWAKSHNISRGDELNVEEDGRALRVYPGDAHLLSMKTSIDFSGMNPAVVHSIMALLHKSGYDEIEILFNSPETVKVIQDRINSMLIGYEIIEQKRDFCIVKNVSGDHISEIETLVRRAFLVTLSFAKNSLDEIKGGNRNQLKELLVLEKTNNKLVNYCQRLLNKSPYKDARNTYTYIIVWLLESVCDDYRDMINLIITKRPKRINRAFTDLMEEVCGFLESYYDLFYNYSDEKLAIMKSSVAALRDEILNARLDSYETMLGHYLFSIANRVADCLGSTAGLYH